MIKKIPENTTTEKEKSVSVKEPENDNKLNAVNRDAQFFKIQVYSDRIHTFTTIYASIAFVAFSFLSLFYGLYYEGFFEVKPSIMLTGYVGSVVIIGIVLIVFEVMLNFYVNNTKKISDMIRQ